MTYSNGTELELVQLKVLVIGANGQDGRLLTKIALQNGDTVFGVVRGAVKAEFSDIGCEYLVADFAETATCNSILDIVKPDVIFHLAASHANSSNMKLFQENNSQEIFNNSFDIAQNILDWQKRNLKSRSVMALSSHMYSGIARNHSVDENCIPAPLTDYGKAKTKTLLLVKEYRKTFRVNCSGAILFNHSSVFSRKDFLYPLLASQICEVLLDKSKSIEIRNFDTEIDISDAQEVCEAMYRMSQLASPDDFVLGSGRTMNLREITHQVLKHFKAPSDIELNSTAVISATTPVLTSNPEKARRVLGWSPEVDAVSLLIRLVNQQLSNG